MSSIKSNNRIIINPVRILSHILLLSLLSENSLSKIIKPTPNFTSLKKLNFQSQVTPYQTPTPPESRPLHMPSVYRIPAKPGFVGPVDTNKQAADKIIQNATQIIKEVITDVKEKDNPSNSSSLLVEQYRVDSRSSSNCLYSIDYSMADAHAKKFPRQNVKSLETLARDLTQPFPYSPILKARAIFTWFHYNIAYDTVAFFGGKIIPKSTDDTLRTGISVCQGYADLYAKLAEIAGLEVKVITGHAKGIGFIPIERTGGRIPPYSSNHAWNAVKLNGNWQLIDSAWGAGVTNENKRYVPTFDPKFFCSTPEEFRIRHFPEKPEYQYCSDPISWNEYITMKEGPLIYIGFSDKGFSEFSLEPKQKVIEVGDKPVRFLVRNHCPDAPIKPSDRVVLVLTTGGKLIMPLQMEEEGKLWSAVVDATTLKANITGGKIQLDYISRLGSKPGNGLTLKEFEKDKNEQGYGLTGLALWDVKNS